MGFIISNMDTTSLTITDALDAIANQKLTSQTLAEACYDQINRLNPTLKAYITIIPPQEMLSTQQPPLNTAPLNYALRGIPIAVKDMFDTEGILTTAGSKFFAEFIPTQDAFVVDKLKQSGALINGKTNTHEIALGITGQRRDLRYCQCPVACKDARQTTSARLNKTTGRRAARGRVI
jgi:aspartyl-tRNA(Asn)/glutamyl-tRNA(Gln) amidotransferase subunit A